MADTKKIITISDGSSGEDLQAIETKIDKLMDIKATDEAPTPEAPPTNVPQLVRFKPAASAPPKENEGTASIETESADEPENDVAKLTTNWKASGITGDSPEDPEIVASDGPIDREAVDKALAELDTDKAPDKPKTAGFGRKLKQLMAAWWHNRKARWSTLGGLLAIIVILAILPPTRAFGLNLIGVRANASLTVLDATTQLPLKNANVNLGTVSGRSDSKGHVTLHRVRLGSQKLTVHKIAFATLDQSVSTGLGSNDLGSVALKAVGTQYKFTLTDYVSGKPVQGAQAASGQATALSDSKGHVILTADDPGTDTLPVSITANGYRTATVNVKLGTSNVTAVPLVINLKSVYISKQSGKYDLYQTDIDGHNKKLLLAATGNETSNNTLVASNDGQAVALVNNRDTNKDSSGYLLQTLTIVNVDTGAPTIIDHSERIQIVGWQGERLVYVAIKAGASAANPSRYLLMSYDYKTTQRLQLDHANAFNDVVSAGGAIYYATSNGYNGGVSQFVKVNADGSGKQALLVSEVWNVFRLDYTDFRLATGDTNYSYTLGGAKPVATKDSSNSQNRLYIDSPDGKHSLWVDNRDGKGTLISYDTTTKKDTVLAQAAGLNVPAHWLGNNTIVYRLKTSDETADYVVSASGGTPKKITDVTDTPGLTLWYYY